MVACVRYSPFSFHRALWRTVTARSLLRAVRRALRRVQVGQLISELADGIHSSRQSGALVQCDLEKAISSRVPCCCKKTRSREKQGGSAQAEHADGDDKRAQVGRSKKRKERPGHPAAFGPSSRQHVTPVCNRYPVQSYVATTTRYALPAFLSISLSFFSFSSFALNASFSN